MTINEREAEANNDSDGYEHGVKQEGLGTEQRPNAAAPKEKNQRRGDDAEQHCNKWEWPQRTNPSQKSTHSEKSRQIQSEERKSERKQRPEQNCGQVARRNGLSMEQCERGEICSEPDYPRHEKDGDNFHGARSVA
jgi:hypothetical protein